jgi:hypothetical protein
MIEDKITQKDVKSYLDRARIEERQNPLKSQSKTTDAIALGILERDRGFYTAAISMNHRNLSLIVYSGGYTEGKFYPANGTKNVRLLDIDTQTNARFAYSLCDMVIERSRNGMQPDNLKFPNALQTTLAAKKGLEHYLRPKYR